MLLSIVRYVNSISNNTNPLPYFTNVIHKHTQLSLLIRMEIIEFCVRL
jgi:hypothetical protein